jgi:hypothetical protein
MKRTTFNLLMFLICVTVLSGQAPQAPKPGPEHQKLGAFVGNWNFTGEMKPGPMGPGGKMTGSDRVQWIAGNFAIERGFEGKGPMGTINGLEVIAYDSAKKTYTYQVVDSTGGVSGGTATNNGDAWTFTGSVSMAGKSMQERCNLTLSGNNSTLKIACEMSADGKSFAPTFEGTATKTK